jgi:hypothetical protein|nr:MAG TPA: hypothetical protein [Caudoviricetes sp.]
MNEVMKNEAKECLDMIASQVKARINRCVEEADKYTKDMNEDYEHFFCWYSEDMYKVQLQPKIYRELQKVVNDDSLCETLGWMNHMVEGFTDDLLCGSVQNHSTNASFNTAHLLDREVKQQVVREFKMMLARINNGGTEK